jgi:hypothetical protein
MKKFLIVTLLIFFSCGPSEEEIETIVENAVEEAVSDLSTTTTSSTTTTTSSTTTTTSSTTTTTSSTTTTIPIKRLSVGIMAPLTGDLASFGPFFVEASKLAISEVNAEIAVYKYEFVPYVKDDSCSDKILDNFQEVIDANISYVVGPACSYDLQKLIESGKLRENPNLVLISPTVSSSTTLSLLSDSIYTLHPEGAINFDPSKDFVQKYDSRIESEFGTIQSSSYSRINEARYYDSTYILLLLLIDNFINQNTNTDLEKYTNDGTKCNTNECISLLIEGKNIDYVGAIGDFSIINNHSDK